MDPTTLVTFLFRAPPEARTVELLGSWDNFRQPYLMHHDRRRGTGCWSGCFRFHNIIFDGVEMTWTKPRTGGLKQGGTYWYYYRLDDQIEAYDDSRECTNDCPLMPGQTMNVIEVPIEIEDRPNRSRSASAALVDDLDSLPHMHTLEPGDRFACPDPPPISRVHLRCRSDLALGGRLENRSTSSGSSAYLRPPSRGSNFPRRGLESDRKQHPGEDDVYSVQRSSRYSRQSWCSQVPSGHSGADTWRNEVYPFQFRVEACADDSSNESRRFNSDEIATRSQGADAGAYDHPFLNNYGPFPSRNIRPHTAPLCTTLQEQASRPRLSSLPRTIAHDIHGLESYSCLNVPPQPPRRPRPSPPTSSEDEVSEVLSERGSNLEVDLLDLVSPTFTATTVSSNGRGLNTPFRLSDTHTTASGPTALGDDSIEGVAERLRSLGSSDRDTPPMPFQALQLPSLLTMYSLPSAETTQSTLTAGKLSMENFDGQDMLPSIAMPETRHDSFAELVFSELNI